MQVLVDTSIWVDHFRRHDPHLESLLLDDRVVLHDHVIGEIAMGSIRARLEVLEALLDLPRATMAEEQEVRRFVEARRLFGRGIGYTDAHILASVVLDGNAQLWTRDSRLAHAAEELGVGHSAA